MGRTVVRSTDSAGQGQDQYDKKYQSQASADIWPTVVKATATAGQKKYDQDDNKEVHAENSWHLGNADAQSAKKILQASLRKREAYVSEAAVAAGKPES